MFAGDNASEMSRLTFPLPAVSSFEYEESASCSLSVFFRKRRRAESLVTTPQLKTSG